MEGNRLHTDSVHSNNASELSVGFRTRWIHRWDLPKDSRFRNWRVSSRVCHSQPL